MSELLVTKIRAEQRLEQMRLLQETLGEWQRDWMAVRSTYGKILRESMDNTPWQGDVRRVTRSEIWDDTPCDRSRGGKRDPTPPTTHSFPGC